MPMNSSVPYLIRAINEWILDNDYTPYMVVDATMDDVSVPLEFVKDGQIILNIGPSAIRNLVISADYVMFSGRFNGIAHEIYAPVPAVMGIIAKENGEGMWFPREESDDPPASPPGGSSDSSSSSSASKASSKNSSSKKKGPPSLKVVK